MKFETFGDQADDEQDGGSDTFGGMALLRIPKPNPRKALKFIKGLMPRWWSSRHAFSCKAFLKIVDSKRRTSDWYDVNGSEQIEIEMACNHEINIKLQVRWSGAPNT